jgi:hypothetical protein
MSKHATISSSEAADRLAIRELVEAYAHCADRRDAKGQMSQEPDDRRGHRGHREAAPGHRAHFTTTFPTIKGWSVQKY